MYDQNNKPPNVLESLRLGAAIMQLLVRIVASTNHAFFRTGFGTRYFGAIPFFGIFSISLFAMMFPPTLPAPFMFFMPYVYLILMIFHRVRGPGRRHMGYVHSLYNGTPIWTSLLGLDEFNCKARYEFGLNSLVGMGIMTIDPIAGFYLVLSSFASHLDNAFINSEMEEKVEAIIDAEIESEILQNATDRFRSRYK